MYNEYMVLLHLILQDAKMIGHFRGGTQYHVPDAAAVSTT
jgi:hypothetical protein